MRGLRRREAVVMDASQKKSMAFSLKENDAEALIIGPYLQKKVGPAELQNTTRFNAAEIKTLYRAFKATAPSTVIHRDLLRSIFREFFRRGDVEHYADLVFNAINVSHTGSITFSEYLKCLSVLCRGSMEEKIEWIYNIYDPLGKGYVSCERVQHVMTSVADLLGTHKRKPSRPEIDVKCAQEVFQRFNPNSDGVITKKDFLEKCLNDPSICESIDVFKSILFK
ncbi:unnamed protein product [Bursaphelenchus xylophilus]|uniref:(pine wood nematode) hypothetical protein n=1 Tax=Bursaphelenchus xylophilus TaxID=6326 RepID=A0A1I7SU82_BURXY|nr:unnamed protein product [Bursaphelenchus xylophilus]CAG9107457.1 unnamed protein product [Bursaphelenchus xylophilus]